MWACCGRWRLGRFCGLLRMAEKRHGGGRWHRWQFRIDEGFYLVPDARVVFDLDVRAHEEAGVPGVLIAVDVGVFVVELIVSEDLGAGGVCGTNGGSAVEETVQLIEVDGLRYV